MNYHSTIPAVATASEAIPLRPMQFDFPESFSTDWCPDKPEFAYIVNAFMQPLAYLEPFFVHSVMQARNKIIDEQLRAEVDAYAEQEARHALAHRRYNKVTRQRYPELLACEERIKARMAHKRNHAALNDRLAYTAGYEVITHSVARMMLVNFDKWLMHADPHIMGLIIWHMVEEIEHKNVALETLLAIDRDYFVRQRGLGMAIVETVGDILEMVRCMMQADGLWRDVASRMRMYRTFGQLFGELAGGLVESMLPGYHPSRAAVPELVELWRTRFSAGEDLRVLSAKELQSWATS